MAMTDLSISTGVLQMGLSHFVLASYFILTDSCFKDFCAVLIDVLT